MNQPSQVPTRSEAGVSTPTDKSLPASSEAPELQNLPVVPDYELLRRIGRGSYGDVWLARSKATGVLRAAKIVWRHTFEDERPFKREFEGIQRFERISREHPSQLALFHIGRNEPAGYFYYVMELADDGSESRLQPATTHDKEREPDLPASDRLKAGLQTYIPHTLRADLDRGRLPANRVLEIGLALSEALGHLHRNGLVHRDVKPSNVIFVNDRPKLADIGLVTDASDRCSIVGTEGYLPPEGPGTPQADIFALGKVLYEAATGLDRREFPKLPEDLRSWLDVAQVFELNEIILKACAQHSGQRYQTCDEMHADLALLGQGKSVRRKQTRQQRWMACKRAGIGLAAVAILALGVVILSREIAPTNLHPDGSPSMNMDANMYCDKGMLIIRGDNIAEFAEAYTNFHRAIELDLHFARPYIGLLELRLRETVPSLKVAPPEELRTVARELQKLAPNLAATHCAQAIINWYDWNFPEAQRRALQAIRANPEYELGHTWYGFMLCMWGYPIEGRAQLEISRALAPSKVTIYRCLGQTYYLQRDYTNAIAWERQALDLEQHHEVAFYTIGQAQQAMGDYMHALDNIELSEVNSGFYTSEMRDWYGQLRQALKEGGARGYWLRQWEGTEKNLNGDFYWKAVIQIRLGNTDAALSWLKKSCDIHERNGQSLESPLNYVLWDECWDPLHDDKRFKAVLEKIGFTKVRPPKTM